ncbi:MAG: TIGR02391 family protein [Gammaproteobacteria bacterium]|nr:TIGR02391 family protein [Gammaproteobacteria bacterium]
MNNIAPFEMTFDPRTIEHLGVKMYSTLPPALAELISNSYDADASKVTLIFHEQNSVPESIQIIDNGEGMLAADIQSRFLVIGRNRRKEDGDDLSAKFHRLPTGKKGLGKLALFGLAKTITIITCKEGKESQFELDWDSLIQSSSIYNPKTMFVDQPSDKPDGTVIRLSRLKRVSPFDIDGLANSLSKIFIVDDDFSITLESTNGEKLVVNNARRYSLLEKQFEWDAVSLIPAESAYEGKISGVLYTGKKPITPSSGLRGITLFSRGKLVNAPECFSNSASSNFFQYLTGFLSVDFIDLLDEDVISTNRQAINWEHEEMAELRKFLSGIVSQVNKDWRVKRKELKKDELKGATGIDTEKWLSTLPDDVRAQTNQIVETLGGEDALERFTPVIKALHNIIPEYPQLHWRHLHSELKDRVEEYYKNQQYGEAADQGTKIYCEVIRSLTGLPDDGTDLTGKAFGGNALVRVADTSTESGENIQKGQEALSRGLIIGFRNPVSHAPIDSVVPNTFSELDCLNILSMISYLLTRLDNASISGSSA